MAQLLQLRQPISVNFFSNSAISMSTSTLYIPTFQFKALPLSSSLSHPFNVAGTHELPRLLTTMRPLLRSTYRLSSSRSDIIYQLELGRSEEKPVKRVNGIFWIILLNIGIYAADHLFQVQSIKSMYLYHNWPAWYQFITATFCHADWNHLSSNLFFLYIFGKLVEEEEGNFALWFSYIITGAGANLVSWLLLPRNSVSVGASGAVFGLFAISVLVKVLTLMLS
ncbi:hypothetical protein SAY86_010756 [Trapa natans]|uniref:Peptidase S54 rhomboid domain-containing protein n=1 Tax=Trapa natans TaxID=22666 RepID=A0AAN7LUF2_TRANT|nr:hypothetical protein SAY86_010756 [Trapa natans]